LEASPACNRTTIAPGHSASRRPGNKEKKIRNNSKPKNWPVPAYAISNLHGPQLPPACVAVGEKYVPSRRLASKTQMTGRMVRDEAARAANLDKTSCVLLYHNVGEKLDRGRIGDDQFGSKRFWRQHLSRVRTFTLD